MRIFRRAFAERVLLRIFSAALPVIVGELERATKRGEHAEAEQVDLQQLQLVEIVLVPLHDGAVFHRGVLDRHELIEAAGGDDDAADMLREMARKTHQLVCEFHHLHQDRTVRVYSGLAHALLVDLRAVPPLDRPRKPRKLQRIEPERLAHIAHRAARAVHDHRRSQC